MLIVRPLDVGQPLQQPALRDFHGPYSNNYPGRYLSVHRIRSKYLSITLDPGHYFSKHYNVGCGCYQSQNPLVVDLSPKSSTIVTRTDVTTARMACCMVYSIVRRTIGFPYKRRYGVRTQYSTRSSDRPLIELGAPTFDEDPLL